MAGAIALKSEKADIKPSKTAPETWAQHTSASLLIYEPTIQKGKPPQLGAKADTIEFQFNPKEVSITKSAKWERKPTKDKKAGPPEYSGAEPCKMTLELFFDAAAKDGVNVVEQVDKLFGYCVPYRQFAKKETEMPRPTSRFGKKKDGKKRERGER